MLSLGPLGQLPGVSTYTIITLGFPVRDENQQAVISLLEKAASQIIVSLPWLAGQVVNEKSEDGASSGTFKVVEYKPHEQKSNFVRVKDCKDLLPSYTEIIKACAPFSILDGNIISPAFAFPNIYPNDVTQPVILMQANFVKGGLLLTSCGHHLTMDGNGHEQFVRQFARLCRGEKLVEEHVRMGNTDQETVIPPLSADEEPSFFFEMLRCPSMLNAPRGKWPPPDSGASWRCFRFTASKIAALKTEALKDCSRNANEYVSTDDAVTTFIWSRLLTIRSKELPKDSKSMLIRCVNGRKRLDPPLSEGYMGHSILCTYTTLPLSNILEDSLSTNAIKVRKSLTELNDHQVRSFFHLVKSEKDKTTINYGAKMNPATDFMITSFIGQQLYNCSFGDLLGMPDFVRRPRLPDGVGLCYMLPKDRGGNVDIVFGVSDKEFDGLKADVRWREFVKVIG